MTRGQNDAHTTQYHAETRRLCGDTTSTHNVPNSAFAIFRAGENNQGWLGTRVLRGEFINAGDGCKADLIAHDPRG
jgi:hypothetical protein